MATQQLWSNRGATERGIGYSYGQIGAPKREGLDTAMVKLGRPRERDWIHSNTLPL